MLYWGRERGPSRPLSLLLASARALVSDALSHVLVGKVEQGDVPVSSVDSILTDERRAAREGEMGSVALLFSDPR